MQEIIEIPAAADNTPIHLRHLRAAAYCRVSTEQEGQDTSLILQKRYYRHVIDKNPFWTNVGIFSEKAPGLSLDKRPIFCAMMRECQQGKIDLILVKSISRFGRNALDMLKALRQLDALSVEVYFEEENLWLSQKHSQMLLSIYCAYAQAESKSMSENIRWGIRQGFHSGTSGYTNFVCFGYKRDVEGQLVLDELNAKIACRIFEMRAAGSSLNAISVWLYENQIPSPTGKSRWNRETISKLLRNEKYVGNVLLQKTFVEDFLSGRQIKNQGELAQFLIQSHHPVIISRELFERVNKLDV